MRATAADDVDVIVDLREPGEGTSTPSRRTGAVVLAVAVLVPLLLFGWRALQAPVNFDGAMNLQVAARLADGDGYTRNYGDVEEFPHEVQTNGPYIYAAAMGIALLGHDQLGYQAANLLFVAGFAVTVALLLRARPRWLRAAGPVVVLLGVPSIGVYALGGLGEVPTTFFLFLAVLAIAAALRSIERAPLWVLGASVAFGAALATKTFAVGAAAALAVGVAAVLLTVPTRRTRVQVVLATAGVALVPAVRELHKLVSLGSLGEYRAWWNVERSAAADQSGLEDTGGSLFSTFGDHLQELSRQVDFPAPLLAVVLFLPLAWVGLLVVARWRADGLGPTLSDPHLAVLVMLAGLAGLYIAWWLCFLPESKLWVRRMLPGLFALHVLYLFMVPGLVETVRARQRAVGIVAALGLAAVVVAAVPYGWARVDDNTRDLVDGEQPWLEADEDAATYIREHQDLRWYGDGWWSAPAVSLMARTDLRDLSEIDVETGPCDLDPDRDRLVWDLDARGVAGTPSTRDGTFVFTEVESYDGYVQIYAVGCG
ncbi:MAG TPA: hypothetical protein VK611_05265 [Acidimicrobiales bacterium]|nr:hypothetical protein [Acidimicrobiales bacterium]